MLYKNNKILHKTQLNLLFFKFILDRKGKVHTLFERLSLFISDSTAPKPCVHALSPLEKWGLRGIYLIKI
jgi:hypothetical protein